MTVSIKTHVVNVKVTVSLNVEPLTDRMNNKREDKIMDMSLENGRNSKNSISIDAPHQCFHSLFNQNYCLFQNIDRTFELTAKRYTIDQKIADVPWWGGCS